MGEEDGLSPGDTCRLSELSEKSLMLQNVMEVCHPQMGIKLQTTISTWVCPLRGQRFTQQWWA